MIRDIAFTAYPCADVAATRAWYEQHLGLTFSGPYVEDGSEKYNEAPVGGACFALMWHEWMEAQPGSGNGVAFEVDDITATVENLKSSGLDVAPVYETPGCKIASVRDPEGNKVILHQINPERQSRA
jgi:predicted enzyme related to lactoylglutathione lyase